MNTVKVDWAPQYGTAQIWSSGAELALCSADNQQIGPFVWCKDFFGDAAWGHVHQKRTGIYGYVYDPSKQPPVDFENIRLLLGNVEVPDLSSKLANVADFLNQIEIDLGFDPSVYFECVGPPSRFSKSGVSLWVGDGMWMVAPPLLSLYGLIIRNGSVHTIGTPWRDTVAKLISGKLRPGVSNDAKYFHVSMAGLDHILKNGIDKVFGLDLNKNYPGNLTTSKIHHYSGSVSFGSADARTYFPQWSYPENPVAAGSWAHS